MGLKRCFVEAACKAMSQDCAIQAVDGGMMNVGPRQGVRAPHGEVLVPSNGQIQKIRVPEVDGHWKMIFLNWKNEMMIQWLYMIILYLKRFLIVVSRPNNHDQSCKIMPGLYILRVSL